MARRVVNDVARPLVRMLKRDSETFADHVPGGGYQFEAAEVMRRIRAGERESPIMTLDDTITVLETLDAIRRSWASA